MKSKILIFKLLLALTILLIILFFFRFSQTKVEKNSNYVSIIKDSLSLSPELYNEIKDKLVLRLREGYCDACIREMLFELDKNTKLNNSNFIIVTQFNDNRMLKFFKEYSSHKVINYADNILPFDTILKSHTYFLYISMPHRKYMYMNTLRTVHIKNS